MGKIVDSAIYWATKGKAKLSLRTRKLYLRYSVMAAEFFEEMGLEQPQDIKKTHYIQYQNRMRELDFSPVSIHGSSSIVRRWLNKRWKRRIKGLDDPAQRRQKAMKVTPEMLARARHRAATEDGSRMRIARRYRDLCILLAFRYGYSLAQLATLTYQTIAQELLDTYEVRTYLSLAGKVRATTTMWSTLPKGGRKRGQPLSHWSVERIVRNAWTEDCRMKKMTEPTEAPTSEEVLARSENPSS
jgi:hypothetical protein